MTSDQTCSIIESTPSIIKTNLISTNNKREGEDKNQQSTELPLAESQFYARSSTTPCLKQHNLNNPKQINEIYLCHDSIDNLHAKKDEVINDKGNNNKSIR